MAKFNLVNGVLVEMTAEEQAAREAEESAANAEQGANAYKTSRAKKYPSLKDQLDQLYRDINAGKFGSDAKTGEWFVGITSVKTANPKPS